MHPRPTPDASAFDPTPGAAAVGRVLDLTPFELQVVVYLRLWCGGARGQAEVWQDLDARLGAVAATAALRAFERLVQGLLAAARRPLVRHALDCPCLGGDEAAIVRAVALAAGGDRDEAALLLSWIAAPSAAADLVARAEDAGLRLAAGSLPPRSFAASRPH